MEGRYTIVAFNSVGFPYIWNTTIREVADNGDGSISIIHKPKGKKTYYKHTYNKDNELKVYKGWLNNKINEWEIVSYDSDVFPTIEADPVLTV